MLIGANIGVIGGGIGGLACARALAMYGAQVTIYEQSDSFSEVGAGIQISPNGARVLDALGVSPRALKSEAVVLKDGLRGYDVARLSLTQSDFRLIHRADLIGALSDGLEALGIRAQMGANVEGVDVANGTLTTGAQHDFLIGADGVHSVVRPALGNSDAPFFTGQVAWRALAECETHPPEARVYMAPGAHVVTYPLRDSGLVNIVAIEERSEWPHEGWHHEGECKDLQSYFKGFCPDVQNLLSRVSSVHRWGLFRYEVAQVWGKDRAAIIGDAAHPTLPFLAQGANLALEDAWVLASCLSQLPTSEALSAYHAARTSRVTRAIAAANANAARYHLSGAKRTLAHMGLKAVNKVAPHALLKGYDWLYDFDVTRPTR